jgi:hypothetical protein
MRNYLTRVPIKLPKGEVLAHSQVRPQYPLGFHAAWTQKLGDAPAIVPCTCFWQEAVNYAHGHYRVALPLNGRASR